MLQIKLMQKENDIIGNLQNWACENDNVRAAVLIGSRANPNAHVDILSDYDIELFVNDISTFMDDKWLDFFGNIMIRWPFKPMSTFSKDWITRLVLFESGIRIDFQITAKKSVDSSAYNGGFRLLVDKDGLMKNLKEPTFSKYFIKKPTEEEYQALVNGFFWDATYIAKNLWREELYYAKYMLDNIIRFEYLQKMIEWYIALQHDWSVSTNKHGRFFKRYLDSQTWTELETTFSDGDIENNWIAFFNMLDLFRKLSKDVAKKSGYSYPDGIDLKVTEYCRKVKTLEKK